MATHRIPAGSHVLFSPYTIHRNANEYDRPTEFDPDRWPADSPVARSAYIPFGAGNRSCIGESLAWTEMSIFVATLLRPWRLHPGAGDPFRPVVTAGLRPAPATIVIRRRS